jgi:glycosyltransferase involved in cell wall biosynthesis
MRFTAILSEFTESPARGGNRYWFEAITALRGRGHEVDIISTSELPETQLLPGISARLDPYSQIIIDGVFWKELTGIARLSRVPPIIFTQEDYVYRRRGWFARMQRRLRMRMSIPLDCRHIVVSKSLARRMASLGARQVRCVLPGLACPVLEPRPSRLSRDHLAVVHAGHFTWAKGQELVMRSLVLLRKRHPECSIRVHFFGDASGDPHMAERIAELGRQNGVQWTCHGVVNQRALWDAFSTADAFAFPSTGEGWPLVVAESMCHGCVPIIGAGESGPEQVSDGNDGLLVERNPSGIASVLHRLCTDRGLLERLSIGAHAKARKLIRPWSGAGAEFADAAEALTQKA